MMHSICSYVYIYMIIYAYVVNDLASLKRYLSHSA